MAFERNLYIDQWGRLRPRHDRFKEDSFELSNWGHTCDCCSFGCTSELAKQHPDRHDVWRFETKFRIRDQFDSRKKKFNWLQKRFPGMMRQLGEQRGYEDEIYWFYTPRLKWKYPWWWTQVVERHGGLR
jgi:hypothetical protein